MKARLHTLALLVLFFTAGAYGSQGWTFVCTHDEKIDPQLRAHIKEINTMLIASMQHNEPNVLTNMLIDEVKKQPNFDVEIKNAYKTFKPLVDERAFNTFTQCHIISKGSGRYQLNVPSGTKEKFFIQAERISDETYICFLTSESYFFDYMVSIIYSKVNSKWRVQKIHIGMIRIAGQSSIGWYQNAQELFEKGNIARAFLSLEIARVLLRPSPFTQYVIEKEVIDIYDRFNTQMHTKIYVRLSKLATSPKLYNITGQFIDMKLTPKLTYVTRVAMKNESELKKEAAEMAEEIEKLFPGFIRGHDNIAYVAYNEIPSDPNRTYEHKDFSIDVRKKEPVKD